MRGAKEAAQLVGKGNFALAGGQPAAAPGGEPTTDPGQTAQPASVHSASGVSQVAAEEFIAAVAAKDDLVDASGLTAQRIDGQARRVG